MEVCKKCMVELYCPDCDAKEIARLDERCSVCGWQIDVCPNNGQGNLFRDEEQDEAKN